MSRTGAVLAALAHGALAQSLGATPFGPGPFGSRLLQQPVPGAPRGAAADGWRAGRLCDITKPPYNAVGDGKTNATEAIRRAIADCGDRPDGGTVLLPAGSGVFITASQWLRSNLTIRVEEGATLQGTVPPGDAPWVYTRRECVMMSAHAGLLNAGRCTRMKDPSVGWDDCAEWTKLTNVVLEGSGTIDGNGEHWLSGGRERPMMLDLLWVDGLTIRDLRIRRPGFWTIHPAFCNNVRVTGLDVYTRGHNTDGIDPDSTWNMYIANNTFDNGDDCIAIKSGRDWSGLMVNISTANILAEKNHFRQGHGVAIGSETSGGIHNVTIRDSELNGTQVAVRVKSCRARGGRVEHVLYEGLRGSAGTAVSLTLNYCSAPATNDTATPEMRNIVVRNVNLEATSKYLECMGLSDSNITGIVLDNVTVTGKGSEKCDDCTIQARNVSPKPCGQ
eukprot:TRINITY_DN61368_c0_g1_i1.p1 TRINITY_DN61368_c0_g1~~TRINITY_DN61368_c0_g1_i1.p1  ORF type:complete len:471 (+),score=87.24 TRINITY_DN61368_c0_g1_i1:76-1413(+)